MSKRWNQQEFQVLKDSLSMKNHELADMLGRSKTSIQSKISKSGLKRKELLNNNNSNFIGDNVPKNTLFNKPYFDNIIYGPGDNNYNRNDFTSLLDEIKKLESKKLDNSQKVSDELTPSFYEYVVLIEYYLQVNKIVSNLEIKNDLRKMGYKVTQGQVSEFMNSNYEAMNLDFEVMKSDEGNNYREYFRRDESNKL